MDIQQTPVKNLPAYFVSLSGTKKKRFETFYQFCVESLERGDSSLMCGEELLLLYIF